MPELTDQELIILLQSESTIQQGFRLLVQKYQERIYWQVRRMVIVHDDADDVVQNIFVKIYRNILGFKGNSGLYTWIFRITVNETISFLHQQKRFLLLPIKDYENQLSEYLIDDQYFTGDEVELFLQQAILKLPPKQRLIFNMKYFDDSMTFEDLAEILNLSVGTVKSSYHFAVKKIEKYISDN